MIPPSMQWWGMALRATMGAKAERAKALQAHMRGDDIRQTWHLRLAEAWEAHVADIAELSISEGLLAAADATQLVTMCDGPRHPA